MTKQLTEIVELLGNKYLPSDANTTSKGKTLAWVAPIVNEDIILDDAVTGGDVYQLLEQDEVVEMALRSGAIALYTCGWGAPIQQDNDDEGVPPSQHPERRRIALLVCANNLGETVSTMRTGDDKELVTSLDGTGTIIEAMLTLFNG